MGGRTCVHASPGVIGPVIMFRLNRNASSQDRLLFLLVFRKKQQNQRVRLLIDWKLEDMIRTTNDKAKMNVRFRRSLLFLQRIGASFTGRGSLQELF